jgi:hypothetical protein
LKEKADEEFYSPGDNETSDRFSSNLEEKKEVSSEESKEKEERQKIELNFDGAPLGEVIRTILGEY